MARRQKSVVGFGRTSVGGDPGDRLTFAVVCLVLVVVSVAASYVPARWATRVNPDWCPCVMSDWKRTTLAQAEAAAS